MTDMLLQTKNLSRRFGDTFVVNDLNLEVPDTSIYGFLGPNGAGKTTTIRMLLGLIRPTSGAIHAFGLPLPQNRRDILQRVGALVETPSLYPHLTGYENMVITQRLLHIPHHHIQHALAIVRLEQESKRLVKEYSLGMKQRLALALALLSRPRLLILDEPTNGLDPAGIQEIRELIQELPQKYGMTVFLSSHLLREVEQIATHVGIIQGGQLLFQGPLTSLQAQQNTHLQLEVNEPILACQILQEAGWSVQHGVEHQLLVIIKNPQEVAAISTLLSRSDITILHLYQEHSSLESIFLELTGKTAVEESVS